MATLRGGTVSELNQYSTVSPHLLMSGFSEEVWRMRQHSSIRVSRLSPVHSRRCAAMSLVVERKREKTLTDPAQSYMYLYKCTLLFPPFPPSSLVSTTLLINNWDKWVKTVLSIVYIVMAPLSLNYLGKETSYLNERVYGKVQADN